MESSLRELAMYRMERAFEMLIAAEDNLKIGQYKTSLNRSYYAIFHDMRAIKGEVACIIFDLNNLKITNDTLGHSVGDQLIMNFARLLRNVVPMKNFVGRYGGDEFVVVICDTSKEEVENILNQLQEEVDQFNRYGRNETISYAYGWAFSKDYTDCTLRVLFDKADHYMYENKRDKKEASKNE